MYGTGTGVQVELQILASIAKCCMCADNHQHPFFSITQSKPPLYSLCALTVIINILVYILKKEERKKERRKKSISVSLIYRYSSRLYVSNLCTYSANPITYVTRFICMSRYFETDIAIQNRNTASKIDPLLYLAASCARTDIILANLNINKAYFMTNFVIQ